MAWSRGESGQSATEYMLVISVIVVALLAAAYTYFPSFEAGVSDLADDVKQMLEEHELNGGGNQGPMPIASPGMGGHSEYEDWVPPEEILADSLQREFPTVPHPLENVKLAFVGPLPANLTGS